MGVYETHLGFWKIFMITKINSLVFVSMGFDSKKKKVFPKWVVWRGRLYPIIKIGFHHTYRDGRKLFHVFSVTSKNIFFKLKLDSESLHWHLEEISDGLPS